MNPRLYWAVIAVLSLASCSMAQMVNQGQAATANANMMQPTNGNVNQQQQPILNNGQQPITILGQQPATNNVVFSQQQQQQQQQQQAISNNGAPATMTGQQPATNNVVFNRNANQQQQQPILNNGQQPTTLLDQQPATNNVIFSQQQPTSNSGQQPVANNATVNQQQQPTAQANSSQPALGPNYRFNPQLNGLDRYKLTQPPIEGSDEQRCMAVAPKRNQDETVGVLYEAKCSDSPEMQYVNYWEVEPKSDIFMIRIINPMMCLTVLPVDDGNAVTPTLAAEPCKRDPSQLFRLKAAPGGTNDTITPYQMIPYTLDACVTAQGQFFQPFILAACDPQYAGLQNWYFENVHDILKGLTTSMTLNEYAARFGMKNFTSRLGLGPQQGIEALTMAEVRSINSTLPGALKPFTMAIDLAKLVRINVQNTWKFHQAGTTLVSDLANIFFTPDQQKGFIGHPLRIMAAIVSAIPIPPVLTKGLMEKAAAYSKQSSPPVTDLLQWDLYALGQSDATAAAMYAAYNDMFATASIDQLSTIRDEFNAGKYDFTAEQFYRNYRVNMIQSMLATLGETFWVGVCVAGNANLCKGNWSDDKLKSHGTTFNDYYISNVPDTALNYLDEKLQERNNFLEGKGNWVLTRYLFTCPNGQCRARLVLRGGHEGPKFEKL
ncbi:hypothetical protein SYNPS1DRAFT_26699 [Syncephalis pseudoplumigaleata]|uniref:Uncharacterized protein n=1 Tax=Syncephalis pseudoplumigaleata TaxID=1712513 RepID=A0A4V1J283_9FUNG|nr:hypothetical protein SYNPS1DRAFT_26699 [Syncephalis pseudoplumigaleata]|eukprot:RKP27659.1 hypothetical protein SYNPS1DRAFT_26699 [Syncephalis pseudoplumigaleata]